MLCSICAQIDTVTHRLTECNKVKEIWYKIQHIISIWLNTPYTSIQPSMITQPDFHYLPSQKHNAVIWIISNVVFLIMDYNREMEMEEFMEILKRSRYKAYNKKHGKKTLWQFTELYMSKIK